MKSQGFTLIEVLVVVLIIGILAAIALPKYQESVERSIMQEAITNIRSIARANDVFFMANGRKAKSTEIEKLDITIPGSKDITDYGRNRIATKYFLYSPGGSGANDTTKAMAHRLPVENGRSKYYLSITAEDRLTCLVYDTTTDKIQRKLCLQVRDNGHL